MFGYANRFQAFSVKLPFQRRHHSTTRGNPIECRSRNDPIDGEGAMEIRFSLPHLSALDAILSELNCLRCLIKRSILQENERA